MPFSKEFDDIYRLGIQESAKAAGIVAERVDELIYSESILERIYRQIDSADFIIADMTGKNPNVFYEVGYAHAKDKLCTLITQHADDIPFDLKHHRHLVYGGSVTKLREMLTKEFAWTNSELERKKTSVFDISANTRDATLEIKDWSRTGSFELVIDIHNRTGRRSPEIDAVYIYTTDRWTFYQDSRECASTEAESGDANKRHLLEVKTNRLAPGAWMQLKCEGRRYFWLSYNNEDEPKDTYRVKGFLLVEISTSEGSFTHRLDMDVEFDELPF